MLIDFNAMPEMTVPGMNGGTGELSAKMYAGGGLRIIPCRIHAGGSIGTHAHPTGDDINYILSGTGAALCDGREERLEPGVCHVCPRGSEHSIVNTGEEDLVMLTVVTER